MTVQLGAKDLRAALEFTAAVQGCCSVAELSTELLPALQKVVACDWACYNEVDLENGMLVKVSYPVAEEFAELDALFMSIVDQHPLVARQQAGDLHCYALSDFLTARQFHRLELYQDCYRLRQTEDQLAFGLGGEVLVAFALSRGRRSFTERDREVLELLRPHLTLAHRQARGRDRDRAFIERLEAGLEERNAGVVVVDRTGRIVRWTHAASELLHAYFNSEHREGDLLPQRLRRELANGARPPAELAVTGDRGRLRIRRAEHAQADQLTTLVLEERRASPPTVAALMAIGLTERQAQILRLVACGKTSPQIAAELRISTATVEKHLENIFARLDVSTRTEAVAVAYS
jgi:DNA-binding CsgD family transcriptional regulator